MLRLAHKIYETLTKRASAESPVKEGFFMQSELCSSLSSDSRLSPSLITAFRETEYRVISGQPFVLRIDEPSAELRHLYKASNLACAVFITAYNPHSQAFNVAQNTERQAELARELRHGSLASFEGIGEHPSGDWPGEPSYLVLGISREAAELLGQRYEQNAIVWCAADGVPRLLLLK